MISDIGLECFFTVTLRSWYFCVECTEKNLVCDELPLHVTSKFNFVPIRFRSSSVKCIPSLRHAVDIQWSLGISLTEHQCWYSRSNTVFNTRSPMCSTLTSNSSLNHVLKFSFAFAAQSLYSLARRFCMFSLRCCLMISSSAFVFWTAALRLLGVGVLG